MGRSLPPRRAASPGRRRQCGIRAWRSPCDLGHVPQPPQRRKAHLASALTHPAACQHRCGGRPDPMTSMTEAAAGFETVICAVSDHVAQITLNRPHRRNALNYQAYDELERAFRFASDDPEVRCVIVTGADPAF